MKNEVFEDSNGWYGYCCQSLFLRKKNNLPAVKVNLKSYTDSKKGKWICWVMEQKEWENKGEFENPDDAILLAMKFRQ
jgi:hypothetical protein